MSEKKIAILAVGTMAVILAAGVSICMILGHPISEQVVTVLGTLAGVLIGGHALTNGVKKLNGNGKSGG